jgi:hypothetical protein
MSVLINDLLAFFRLGRTATAAWSQLDCETVLTGSATPCTPTPTSPNPVDVTQPACVTQPSRRHPTRLRHPTQSTSPNPPASPNLSMS